MGGGIWHWHMETPHGAESRHGDSWAIDLCRVYASIANIEALWAQARHRCSKWNFVLSGRAVFAVVLSSRAGAHGPARLGKAVVRRRARHDVRNASLSRG